MALRDRYRTALVTGAASGLGAAFVEMLLVEGLTVWGTSRTITRVPDRAGFHGLALELANPDSVRDAWTAAERESGGVDLLINNAGEGIFASVSELPESACAQQIDVLLRGPIQLSRLALSAMTGRGRGGIVNVTSLACEFPIPYLATYSAAKAGLAALTAALHLECVGGPLQIVDFRPGDYRTRFNEAMTAPQPEGDARARAVWRRLEHLLRAAPPPERAACDLRRALQRGRSGVVRSGTFFQARLAPFLQRFASQRLSRWVQRRYFELS